MSVIDLLAFFLLLAKVDPGKQITQGYLHAVQAVCMVRVYLSVLLFCPVWYLVAKVDQPLEL